MIIVTGTAKLTDDGWAIALPAMKEMLSKTREEPGCLSYDYARDLEDPSIFRAIEKFKDKEALKAHFTAPHMADFRAALAQAKPEDLVISVYDANELDMAL